MIETYLAGVQTSLQQMLGDRFVSLIVFGSWALDDFQPSSDLDLLAVVHDKLDRAQKERIVETLSHTNRPCPAHGLDFAIYRLDQINPVSREPEYELGFATGRDWVDEPEYGGLYPGGIIDLEIARCHGKSLTGVPTAQLIGAVPREWLEEEVRNTTLWHRSKLHDPFHDPTGANAVLNACRAWRFLVEGDFVSKSAGTAWAMKRTANSELIQQAVDIRQDKSSAPIESDKVSSFLNEIEGYFR